MILACGGYSGFRRGLILELFAVTSLVVAALGSSLLLDEVVAFLAKWYHGQREIVAYTLFVLLFITILVGILALGRLVKAMIKPTLLGSIDKFLGAFFGLLKWALCCSALLWLGSLVQLKIPEAYTADTHLFPIIQSLAPQLISWCSGWTDAIHLPAI